LSLSITLPAGKQVRHKSQAQSFSVVAVSIGRRSQRYNFFQLFWHYLLSAKTALMADEKTERIILKIKAHQKPSILIPFISLAASKIISALITKRKRPSVITVIGRVSKTKIGLTIAFKQASTKANIIAVVIFEM